MIFSRLTLLTATLTCTALLTGASISVGADSGTFEDPAAKVSSKASTPVDSDGYNVKTDPRVSLKTNMGEIVLELNPNKAPNTVKNFLRYVSNKHYEGTIFHRVISDFMIQGGGFDKDMHEKSGLDPIKNEANKSGLKNSKYTIAMARTGNPHSATAQFFINVKDNAPLDFPGQDSWGYCVFGKVISGMDVVDKIRDVKTGDKDGFQNVPLDPVTIEAATLAKKP